MSVKFTLIPCPHEETVSWGKGTKNGPKAILEALKYVENFDEEVLRTAAKPVTKTKLYSACLKALKNNSIPIILGGEHSISPEAVRAVKEIYPDLSVLHLDAHADLRDSYQGRKDSHACAARRMLEICPVVSLGVRSMSKEEYPIYSRLPKRLSKHVYISFDVDVFDPGIMPSTGTPEPGGLSWQQVLNIFKKVCKTKAVVGADFVELAPIKGLHAPDFMIAKLIYKLMGYLSTGRFETCP
ncbi:hypothetical protein A2276_00345 [candidate division WOR-1 bacterium RIFOXYA12_FULL_43_27]|uniref:Agmatinase n=1 Tax=candidate division WOR-1 bacterium RIFOXYC2_FULL_46_14 TaxID=1802587 RepID=A0A1F4U4C1_UNCSA|nr:MAG: hypothetical protein A2276_00345 [candidate division WOR-1 bacterium RIFOXYA12_FULL_43_27]OGC20854.1 MAG: hypothetical protein A2292_07530 [candidate division WOR-1 bacterium RIFOXYB2_FULL_46_45]OGC31408.1 MAG: hypothetical protein A2232_03915 [candidate division WOR-1 bacterium RIFOXYA2_FULL_46_56]OGC39814.1 MAG: hypothetical protein A2438_04750 [candidate division WOR-1 bacterium RIFOXYC2_FULL_46_14]